MDESICAVISVIYNHIYSCEHTLTLMHLGDSEKRAVETFLKEIAMMKKVSSGECCHVVQMVGCVSTALPLALALEYVPFGDLLSYLKYWKKKVRKPSMTLFSMIISLRQ